MTAIIRILPDSEKPEELKQMVLRLAVQVCQVKRLFVMS